MSESTPKFNRALVFSVTFHVILFSAIFLRFAFTAERQPKALVIAPQTKPIEAVAIQEEALQAEIKRLEDIDKEKARTQKAEADRLLAEKKRLEQQKKAEEQRLAQLKKEQEEAKRKLAEEQKRLAAERKKAEEQRLARIADEKAQKERDEKAKAERLKQEKIAEQKRARESELARQMADEEARLNAAQEAERLREIDRYKIMVSQQIMRYWLVQGSPKSTDTTRLLVRVAPSGVVLDVRIDVSSGNDALDRSAVAAVYKASPLPVPEKAELFKSFRELRLTLRPDSIMSEG